jgi:hypothetical protein
MVHGWQRPIKRLKSDHEDGRPNIDKLRTFTGTSSFMTRPIPGQEK